MLQAITVQIASVGDPCSLDFADGEEGDGEQGKEGRFLTRSLHCSMFARSALLPFFLLPHHCHRLAFDPYEFFLASHDAKDRREEHVRDAVISAGRQEIDAMLQVAAMDEVCWPKGAQRIFQFVQPAHNRNTSNGCLFACTLCIENTDRHEGGLSLLQQVNEPLCIAVDPNDEHGEHGGRSAEDFSSPLIECHVPDHRQDEAEDCRNHE